MGVPKFYKWLSERYPLINQIISDTSMLPEVDNFYLDMNGIIHNCSHPNDNAASNKVSERDMMLGIFRYINRCVSEIVKPKKVLFLAIDGVAPRAKMNQQRARRFRAAEERAESIEKARVSNEPINSDELFDSNSITPGTEFMDRVSAHIKYFIRQKIKEDPLWQNLEIIFSGHDVPGEGEHKIMSYIRDQRALPNYSANTRHCMYGQDADLIMLGLATHEPHFVLLREVIDFNANRSFSRARHVTIQQTREAQFQLLHLSVLREYIEVEFASGCGHELNIERLVDDFIFLTFLVGNDFLPHLPTLDIGEHAFDVIFTAYRNLVRQIPGYIVENGSINDVHRLETLCQIIGKQESEILEARQEDVIKQATKASRGRGRMNDITLEQYEHEESEKEALYLEAIEEALSRGETPGGLANLSALQNANDSNNVDSNGNTIIKKDFRGRYYFDKFQKVPGSKAGDEFLSGLMKSYLEGLEWCLAYYMKGCVSWTWYFPYHYGPMLQDMKNLTEIFSNISFTLGQPFLPFQQLLGCLPPLSANLLPPSYRKLMKDNNSPVIEFYPDHFKVDMNGKKAPWEAVVVLPFIDSKKLLDAERELCSPNKLTELEKKRNRFGKVMYLQYSPSELSTYYSCNPEIGLSDIHKCQSVVTYKSESFEPGVCFKSELVPGTRKHYPGFPSLACIPMDDAYHASVKMNVFGSESRYKSLIVCTKKFEGLDPSSSILGRLVGNSVWVNYPQIHEARITAVSTEAGEWVFAEKKSPSRNKEIDLSFFGKIKNNNNSSSNDNKEIENDVENDENDGPQLKFIEYDRYQATIWREGSEEEEKRYRTGRGLPGTGGVEIGRVECRVRVQVLQGMRRDPFTGALSKVFGEAEAEVPLQLVLRAPPVRDIRFEETLSTSAKELLPSGSVVVACDGKMRGMKGEVISTNDDNRTATVKFLELPDEPPFGHIISSTIVDDYVSGRDVAKSLGMSSSVLGKLVGSIFVEAGRITVDMGLNLKRNGVYAMNGYCRMRELDADGNALNTNTVNWSKGDTVTVIGSTDATTTNKDADGFWEYTFAAVGLIAEYKAKFPLLFENLEKYSHLPKYKAEALFGAQAGPMTTKVCEWLNSQKVMSLPRTPLTTLNLPTDAVKAIERAADVRVGTINKDIDDKKINYKIIENIPLTALFRGNVFDATDAPLTFNDGLSPTLGDRVINLTSTGVPFALRGTVVCIHRNTQYVEVVFDEEFTGGKALGGQCSAFRGRLVPWAGLLCLSSSTSQKQAKDAQKKSKQRREETQTKLLNVVKSTKASTTPVTTTSNNNSNFNSLTDALKQTLKIGQQPSVPTATVPSQAAYESPEAYVDAVPEDIITNGAGLSALMAAAHNDDDNDDDDLENDFEASHLLRVQQQIDMQVHMQTQMNFLDFNMPMLGAAQNVLAVSAGNRSNNSNSNSNNSNRTNRRGISNENKNGNSKSRDASRRESNEGGSSKGGSSKGGSGSAVVEKKSQKERKKERAEQVKKEKSEKDKASSSSGLLMEVLGINATPPTTTTTDKEKKAPVKILKSSNDDKQKKERITSTTKGSNDKSNSNESMRSALKNRIAALKGKNQKKDKKSSNDDTNVVPPLPPPSDTTTTTTTTKSNDLPTPPPQESKKIKENQKDKEELKKEEKKVKVSSFIPSNVLRRKRSSTAGASNK